MKFPDRIERLCLNLKAEVSGRTWLKWRRLRKYMVDKIPYCQMCRDDKKLEVHHIMPRHLYPDKALDEVNLVVLCKPCHFRYGHLATSFKDSNPFILKMIETIDEFREDHGL
jgi:5-methylcytosine-specific restriction endonuclease McrA